MIAVINGIIVSSWQKYLDQQENIAPQTTATRVLEDLQDKSDRSNDTESDVELKNSKHSTDFEQSGDENDDVSSTDFTLEKDETHWNLHPLFTNIRTGKENIVTYLPGVKKWHKVPKRE
ncbi:hypothetical protein TNCT_16351 [Trichonephila clavata]|uniref:Uncharacterized protein n=1 Tax=Trichonephila clavata TaxID=2740835 RepID=A0A8X6LMN4_TRICU|nr:hypothetical protein TNCT_16351 [Trichonephila clavata]